MAITIRNLPPIQGVDPSSFEEDRDRQLAEAQETLRKDFPAIRFGDLPKRGAAGGAALPVEPPPLPEGVPETFTYGAKPQPVVEEQPTEEPGWIESIGAGAKIGGKLYSLLNEGAKLGVQDEVARDPEAAMRKYLGRRDGPGPSLASVLPEATATKLTEAAKIEAAKTPEQRNAEREQTLAAISAIHDEMAGLRPKTDDFWKNAAVDATSSIVFMAPALVAGAATGGATAPLALAALGTYYVSYASHRSEGSDPNRAKQLAFVDGVTEAVTELLPAKALFAKTGIFKKFLSTLGADIPGEEVANLIQTTTAELAKLPPDPSNEDVQEAIKRGAASAWEQKEEVAAASALTSGVMAGTARAAQALADRGEKPAAPPPPPPPRTAATPPPAATPAPTAAATPPPAASPAGPTAAPVNALPKPGDSLMFSPTPNVPGTAVQVQRVDPKTQSAVVARVDEEGEPVLGKDGEPVTFVASFDDLNIKAAPPPAAAPAQPAAAPVAPSQVPPAATSAEPTSDIAGQVKDMYRPQSKRRGVYVSPDTVAKMKTEGTYNGLLRTGVVAENFDGQGGTLIVKSKKDMEEAVAARDSGQVDMQAIVGTLTGAGVAKPNVVKPAVVQRKDAAGAVVQQSAVPAAQAPAVAAAMAQQPGTVEVTTPEAALAERAAKVEGEKGTGMERLGEAGRAIGENLRNQLWEAYSAGRTKMAGIDDPALLAAKAANVPVERATFDAFLTEYANRPAAPAQGPSAAPEQAPPAETKQKAKTPLAQLDEALEFAVRAIRTPKEGAGPRATKMDVRGAANAVGALAQSLRVAIAEAKARGATNEDVKQAADAAKAAERLTAKDDADFEKSRGVSEQIVRARLAELSDAVDSLKKWADKPLTKSAAEGDKPAKKPKAEAAKKKKKKAERRKAENAALRERIDKMTPEEREAAIMRHDLTGLPNRRAMETAEAPAWAEVDADSLKWVNDNMGEEAGNQMLKAVAAALDEQGDVTAYHVSGDEFYVSGESPAAIEAALKAAAEQLAGQTIEGKGHTMTPAITWGVGETRAAASAKMKSRKVEREASGKRAKRGEAPPTAKSAAAESPKAVAKRGKQKYVPPKKTEAQRTEETIEKTAPAARETIEIVAQNVEGQESQLVSELLGASPQELAMEANLDKSGALVRVLQSILTAMQNRGNWTGWFAAVTRGGVLSREQRNAMFAKIRTYAGADTNELPAAREDLLGFLTDIDGKTLPPQAIGAVMEAADAARAYTTVVVNVAAAENEDAAEIIEATSQADIGYTNSEGKYVRDPALNTVRRGTEIARGGKDRSLPSVKRLRDILPTSPMKRTLRNLAAAMNENRWINGVLVRAMSSQENGGFGITTHELMDGVLYRLAQLPKSSETEGLRRILTAVRRSMPNAPIEVVEEGKPTLNSYGETVPGAGGRYLLQGMMQVGVPLDGNGLPLWDAVTLETFIHESVHGATMYETLRPDSPLRARLTEILEELRNKARAKYGASDINRLIAYYGGYGQTGDAAEPTDITSRLGGGYMYGLANIEEMVAEALSNPNFHSMVLSLDQTPTRSWYGKIIRQVTDTVRKLLGLKNPADTRFLQELIDMSLRTVEAQGARQARRERYRQKIVADMQRYLKASKEDAEAIAMSALTGVRASGLPSKLGGKRWTLPDVTRGDRDDMLTEVTAKAYFTPPAQMWAQISAQREEGMLRNARYESAPMMRRERELGRITTPNLARATAAITRMMRSGTIDSLKDTVLGLPTMDFLVRRWAHLFGAENDSTNPLNQLKVIRDTRRSFANQMMELAERTVNSKWMKLSLTESEKLGEMLQETTLWQIEPEGGAAQPRLLRNVSKRRWAEKVKEIEAKWNALSPEQQEIYRSVQKYFKTEYSKLRRASMDLAMDLYGVGLTPQQKSLLYALRNPEGADNIIGTGKPIDLADENDRFLKVVKDLIKVSAIKGPYFPLMRKGKYVVEAEDQGILSDEAGVAREFTTKDDALEEAERVRSLAPRNTAVVRPAGDKFVVEYKMRHVSFHETQNDAVEAVVELKQNGFAVKNEGYTRKLESVESASMSGALSELVSKAESLAGTGSTEEREAVLKTIRTAFTEILAERAASASSQLKRQGVGGFKGKEAHEVFTRRVRASSWHYANLKTSVPLQRALKKLRQFSVDPEQGHIPAGHDRQSVLVARGRLLSELVNRMRIEVGELETLDKSNVDHWMGQVGFATFLASPSYAMVNSMQNFNVALPVIAGKYGMKGARALARSMRLVAGPSFGRAMRGLVSKPGEVTTYDVYTAIASAVKEDPRYARFVESPDGGKTPSALQQLVDRNVINATYVQELTSVANDKSLVVSKGMDYLRLLPQAAELWNRVSTALAVLDVTNGNVDKTADMIDQVHFQYGLENRPRFFRKIGGVRLPQAVTMFKMYGVGMYQLGASLMVDAIGRNKTPATRRQAATALAGVIAAHTLSAGIIGGVMMEPLRALMAVWQMAFGDDDEFGDLDTAIQRWATEVTGSEGAGQVLSRGAWNALGFDLSGRMGLDRVLMYNPPDASREDSFWKFFGSTLVGPLVAENVRRGYRAWQMATQEGKPYEAIMSMVPLKAFQDAKKAWELMSAGVTTRAGEEIVSPEVFGVVEAAGRAAGFRTSEESKASAQGATEFRYKNWKTVRMRELVNQYWQARDSGDEREIARAEAAITRFREKNPGVRFTAQNLLQSKRAAREAARSRVGEGRDPGLREQLAY